MIRRGQPKDIKKISDLWLAASLQAHDFIPADYWRRMQPTVSSYYIPNTDTFVFEDRHKIKGFISIADNNYIGALFVAPEFQNCHIGRKLLKYVQRRYPLLSLSVFVKNQRALQFYQQNDFKIISEQTEPSTQERELRMCWGLGCKSGFRKRYYGDS